MPHKSTIAPIRIGDRFRVIIPLDLRGGAYGRTKWFTDEKAAREFCRQLMDARGGVSAKLLLLSKQDQFRMAEALTIAGDAQSVVEAVRFWREQKPAQIATVKELAVRCVAAKEQRTRGGESSYTKRLRGVLSKLILGKEDMLAHAVQPHHVADWINANPEWSQDTRKTYLRDLTTMFSWGVSNGMLTENPAVKVERPSHDEKPPYIFTPEQAERLMRAAEQTDPRLVQFLALCMFAGLRCDFRSEAWRVQPEDIKANEIAVQGKKVRSRNRRFVTINPTLRAWLNRYPGDFSPANMRRRLYAIRAATAGDGMPEIEWNRNPMRHSFVSYYAQIYGTREAAKESGHSEEMLIKQYRERVTTEAAERFWKILPSPSSTSAPSSGDSSGQ